MITSAETTIEADANVPIIRITRDFDATPAQLMRAHIDPELFKRWVGPNGLSVKIDYWEAARGGRWRFVNEDCEGNEYGFYGSFHEISEGKIVQTFTWEGEPDGVSLQTLSFSDLGGGRTRLHAQSLVDSFDNRDAWLKSGMEVGLNDGYAKLDVLLADGAV
jgi:uncharacterized protein YndB with AHSA1/START domain